MQRKRCISESMSEISKGHKKAKSSTTLISDVIIIELLLISGDQSCSWRVNILQSLAPIYSLLVILKVLDWLLQVCFSGTGAKLRRTLALQEQSTSGSDRAELNNALICRCQTDNHRSARNPWKSEVQLEPEHQVAAETRASGYGIGVGIQTGGDVSPLHPPLRLCVGG